MANYEQELKELESMGATDRFRNTDLLKHVSTFWTLISRLLLKMRPKIKATTCFGWLCPPSRI
jgi:hypothetical protein